MEGHKMYRLSGCVCCAAGKVDELSNFLLLAKLYSPVEMDLQETKCLVLFGK